MTVKDFLTKIFVSPIPVAARSKAWVCGRSLARIVDAHYAVGRRRLSVESVVCCQVGVPATDWFLVQSSPIECAVSECDGEDYNEEVGRVT